MEKRSRREREKENWFPDTSLNALSATCNRLQLILYLTVNISATVSEDENAIKGNLALKPADFNAFLFAMKPLL
ncbi:MAG: hypothetical protein WC703_10245 [Candidatus Neomarinimicrobiota bacterium]